jgi:hypothetical protein
MDEMFSTWWDLTDQSISHPDIEYFTDGSSFVWYSTCFARYALVTLDTVTEACLLSVGTSVQKAELITLTWVLLLTAGMQVNIYMDSKYALLGGLGQAPPSGQVSPLLKFFLGAYPL